MIFRNSSYFCLESVVGRLEELGKNNKIVIMLENKDKEQFNSYLMNSKINYGDLDVRFGSEDKLKIDEYLKYEKLLYSLVEGARDLSAFERYIYAYNVTKYFKKYKKESANEYAFFSRNLYKY